jgi:hypothetical protein
VAVQGGGSLILERAAVVHNHQSGIAALQSGSSIVARDVLVSGTHPAADGFAGRGIVIGLGASLDLERASIIDNHVSGLLADGAGTVCGAVSVLIARTQPDASQDHGRGLSVQDGATLILTASSIVENHRRGLFITDPGTTVTVSDTVIGHTKPDDDGTGGGGIVGQFGAQLTLERSSLTENHETAVLFLWAGGSVTDSLLQGTKLSASGTAGFADGLLVTGSVVTTTRVITRGNARAGILYDRSEGDITSCLITDNAVGLADQGLPGATIADDNVVTGNDQNFLDDGGLSVPDEAMEIPDIPELD